MFSSASARSGDPNEKLDIFEATTSTATEALRRYEAATADAPPHPQEPELLTLAAMVAGQAMMQLGVAARPGIKIQKDLKKARHSIDLLVVLEEKTRGNRTDDESKVFQTLLTGLRGHYANAVA